MPNSITVSKNLGIIAEASAAMLGANLQFVKSIDKADESDFKGMNGFNAGDTIQINRPMRVVPTSSFDATSSIQDFVETKVPLTLDIVASAVLDTTSQELATDIDIKNFAKRIIKPAIADIAMNIESTAISRAIAATYNAVGNPGANLIDVDTALAAAATMTESGCSDTSDRYMLVNPRAQASAVSSRKGLFQSASEVASQYKNGYIGRSDGFDWLSNSLLPVTTIGTDVTGVTVKTTVSTQSSTTLVLTGVTTTTGTITAGTIIEIANVNAVHPNTKVNLGRPQQFVVVTGGAGDGSTDVTVTVSPAMNTTGSLQNISAFPQATAAVSFKTQNGSTLASTSYAQNIAYHKSAFRFVSVPLYKPSAIEMAEVRTVNGITVNVCQGFDIIKRRVITRVDVLAGISAARPEFACRIFS